MAALLMGGDNPLESLVGKNAAEKALQPWWESVQDLLLYGLIGFGVIAFPTALVNKDENILKCTHCGYDYCATDLEDIARNNETGLQIITSDINELSETAELIDLEWVNAYCLTHDLGAVVQYFPFILLFLPLCLALVQKIANMIFDSDDNIGMFYRLIMKSVLDTAKSNKMVDREFLSQCSKLCIQIRHSYDGSTSLYRAFISRVILLTIVASLEFSYFTISLIPTLIKSVDFECSIGPLIYTCSGHPGKFYEYLGWISYFLMGVFLACCALNLTWTVGSTKYCEMHRTMSELMKKLRSMEKVGLRKGSTDAELLGKVVHKIFYQNKDLSLLLVLLASSSGIANAFLVMVLFDEDFREELQAGGIDIRGSTTKKYAVDIRVRDEHSLMKAALNSLDGIDIIYTVEISPPLSRNSVFVLPIDPLEELLDEESPPSNDQETGDTSISWEEEQLIKSNSKQSGQKRKTSNRSSLHEADEKIVFESLDPGTSYTITVNTIMNGIEIASKEAKIYQMGN